MQPSGSSKRVPFPGREGLHEVWIVEDDEVFRRRLAELIGLSGIFICSQAYGSCEPAVEMLRHGDPPGLVLMDLGLPGISGIEGIKQMRSVVPDLKIVVLTVFEDPDTILRAISSGAAGYLLKGSRLESIVESLNSIHAGGAPINPQIARKILHFFDRSGSQVDYGLTPRENEVLTHLVEGLPKKQIADRMAISFHTVDQHMRSIYSKLQVPSRSLAVAKALKENLL